MIQPVSEPRHHIKMALNLSEDVRRSMLNCTVTRVRPGTMLIERKYDEATKIATVVFDLYHGNEIFGTLTVTRADDALLPDFSVQKNGKVLGAGHGIVEWCKFLKAHNILASWIEA
ncbi:hypothetical protein LU11_gp387 [Pseudomonas phage Lu11]|uniref:hypothetical protein n=1 Tax=Pseudomonas phage Lu11 TaxID=1161927 RepID=UPI00025F18E0|nr:hypothetical protein LU11_gp387 [Pseudomonas phage Lu11]AFH14918.1 hypothetical protein Lu11_0380 [Pseudomonas phage Lu11]